MIIVTSFAGKEDHFRGDFRSMLGRLLLAVSSAFALLVGPLSAATEPYTIQVILPLTGPASYSGTLYADGLRIYENYVNVHGGLRGQSVHFDIHDDGSQPVTSVQLFSSMIAQHVPVVIGPSPTQTCNALAPLAEKSQTVLYCGTPGTLPPRGGYVFAAAMALPQFDRGMIRYMRLKGYKRLAVISSTDASGQSNEEATRSVLALPESRDLTVVDWEHLNPNDISATALASRIKNSGAQGIVAWVAGPTFATVLRALRDVGLDLPMTATGANNSPDQLTQLGSLLPTELALPGFPFMAPAMLSKSPLRAPVKELTDAFAAAGKQVSPSSGGYIWDSAAIVLAGLRKFGPSATAEQLRGYILGLRNYPGVDGVYDFSIGDQHGLSDDNVVMVAWDLKAKDWVPLSRLGGIPIKR